MNLDPILPNLYVGSCPINPADIDRLQQEFGISAVLNMQTDDDFAYWGIDWERLETHYRRQGIAVRRVPIHDFEPGDLRQNLVASVQALDELMRRGHTVYVHCSAGINRSPSTVVAYLHWIEGRSLEEAVAHVTRCRNCDPYVDAIRSAIEDQRKRAATEASEPPSA